MPDYRIPVVDVYREFILRCLMDDNRLNMLSLVEDRSFPKIENLPSWVADFSAEFEYSPLGMWSVPTNMGYTATGTSTPDIQWSDERPNLLCVQGHEVDQISIIASSESSGTKWPLEDGSYPEEEWLKMIENLPKQYLTGEAKEDSLWRTVIGNCTHNPRSRYPAPQEYSSSWRAFRDFNRMQKYLHRIGDNPENYLLALPHIGVDVASVRQFDELRSNFLDALGTVMICRRFFVTKKGYFGAAPKSAQIDDPVFLLAGGSTPYVLRKRETPGTYTFVGECYTHGIMGGEALEHVGFEWENVRLL